MKGKEKREEGLRGTTRKCSCYNRGSEKELRIRLCEIEDEGISSSCIAVVMFPMKCSASGCAAREAEFQRGAAGVQASPALTRLVTAHEYQAEPAAHEPGVADNSNYLQECDAPLVWAPEKTAVLAVVHEIWNYCRR